MAKEHGNTDSPNQPETIIIGLSGPSSSGKTTLARLLRSVFSVHGMKTFIIHEDDFYFPDDKIPYTTTSSGKVVQDWDTVDAVDVPFLSATLNYVRRNGSLPPRLKSKEDQNDATDSGVDKETLDRYRAEVEGKLKGLVAVGSTSTDGSHSGKGKKLTVAFLEGFLLYAPPKSEAPDHILRPIHENIHLHLFLPAPYPLVKARREGRSGYVTAGSAPPPPSNDQNAPAEENNKKQDDDSKDLGSEQDPRTPDQKNHETESLDLETEEHHPEPQNFWTDPPGYVDDIVWPRYVQDHSWLLLPEPGKEHEKGSDPTEELLKRVGEGTEVRTDAGVTVAPGKGKLPMPEVLGWAVGEVVRCLEVKQGRV